MLGRCELLVSLAQCRAHSRCSIHVCGKEEAKEERDLQDWRQINLPMFDPYQVTQAGKLFLDTD